MSLLNQYRSLLKERPWTTSIFSGLFVLIVLLLFIRVLLPFAINAGTISWLESEGVKAEIFDTKISLWDGTIKIYKVSGEDKNGKGFSVDYLGVGWQWTPFFNRHVKINKVEINALKVDTTEFENGDLNIAGINIKPAAEEEQAEPSENPWDATVENIIFSDLELCYQQIGAAEKIVLDYCGKVAALGWTGDASFKPSIQVESPDVPPVYTQGALTLSGIEMLNRKLNQNLLSIDSFVINNIHIDTPNTIKIDNISVANLSAMQRTGRTSPDDAYIFAFDGLEIKPVTFLHKKNLQLGRIELTGSRSHVLVKKDGHMEYEKWLPDNQDEKKNSGNEVTKVKKEPENKQISTENTEPFTYAFDELIINTNKHFKFIDNSLVEPFVSGIHNVSFKFSRLDSSKPEEMTHASLVMGIDKHGSFKLEADLNPLSKRLSAKGAGEISGLDLRLLTPYTKKHVGHLVKSGQLDTDLKIIINKGTIDSKMALTLHHFDLKSLSKKEAKKLNSEFGFPLSTSLSLLRDRDNAIRLDIPLKGDVDNPDFDPKDAIVKASSKAITTAVLHYYTPFGLVFAAKGLFNLATALNFEPVVFDAGEIKLTPDHEAQLDKLATLMADRPGIHLTLCGFSNGDDKNKLFPKYAAAVAKATTPEKMAKVKPLSNENIASLIKLGESRSAAIKQYMVTDKKIKASRMIECAPEQVDEKISGVEISI